jgi:hypothetical protein
MDSLGRIPKANCKISKASISQYQQVAFTKFLFSSSYTGAQFLVPTFCSQFRLEMECQGLQGWLSRCISRSNQGVTYFGNGILDSNSYCNFTENS